uniref:ribonuclease H n=1 Tax=viral metagenome TaxID=1070528 RepID=A0A6C0JHQ5_9ZZZZ
MIRVFTDGACRSNGKANAEAGYAGYFPDNKDWSFATKMPESEMQTNQRAELKAIHDSVNVIFEKCGSPAETAIQIYTDSMYSKNCLTTWLPGWMKNKWRTAEGSDVKHRDLIEHLSLRLTKFKEYTITYVKAHTGNTDELSIGNDIVDKMAVSVLIPKEVKVINRTDGIFPDLALSLMGPPVEEAKIIEWCKTHLHLLDPQALKTGLFGAFQKTVSKNGYSTEVQRISKTRVVRLTTGLIKEGITIVKEE